VKPPRLGEGIVGRAPSLYRRPWYLPYNCGKITEKPQSEYPRGARLISAERGSISRHCYRGRWLRLACWLLPPLAYVSGDGFNSLSV